MCQSVILFVQLFVPSMFSLNVFVCLYFSVSFKALRELSMLQTGETEGDSVHCRSVHSVFGIRFLQPGGNRRPRMSRQCSCISHDEWNITGFMCVILLCRAPCRHQELLAQEFLCYFQRYCGTLSNFVTRSVPGLILKVFLNLSNV